MLKSTYEIPTLPLHIDLESVAVLKALATANRSLAELKGRAAVIPNQGILIDTLALQEAKASSEIENIVTTQDELFQADLYPEKTQTPASKEVALYRAAVRLGFNKMREHNGFLTSNMLIDMFQLLKAREEGFRATPGTALKNERNGEIVYVPPQSTEAILANMNNLERYINEDSLCSLDPLIKMALIHHQFESIHPFSDGNGRIGRILNVLYLTRTGLLDIPILYLSRHIMRSKNEYYRLLQEVRDAQPQDRKQAWENWVLYMLNAITTTSEATLILIEGVREQMAEMKKGMREKLPKLYSQDMLNNLFRHPYTRIGFVMQDLGFTRQTAAKYLDNLAAEGFIAKRSFGRENYYINSKLIRLFADVSGSQ